MQPLRAKRILPELRERREAAEQSRGHIRSGAEIARQKS
jgi:hypothetical protein